MLQKETFDCCSHFFSKIVGEQQPKVEYLRKIINEIPGLFFPDLAGLAAKFSRKLSDSIHALG